MREDIQLAMGRQSSGEEYKVSLADLPNLFISYSNDNQLSGIFIQLVNQLILSGIPLQVSLALNRKMATEIIPLIPVELLFTQFLHQEYAEGQINTIDEYISSLMKEMQARKKIKTVNNMQPIIPIFIDNIFEIIMAKKKKTALAFVELLMTAASVKMFFILGSSGIYRPLLDQLISINPSLRNKLSKSLQDQKIIQPLGAELVLNPDDLLFFRNRNEKIYTRLYPG